jgi:tetratricopeptide (TPR) repeat protein
MLATPWAKALIPCVVLLLAGVLGTSAAGADNTASPPSCAAAAALRGSGRLAAAEAAYAKALENVPTKGCAKTGLRTLDKEHAVCARAEALARSGRGAEARAAYEEALKTKPGAKCAEQGIRHSRQGFLADPAGTSKSILAWAGLTALLLAVPAVLFVLLGGLLTRVRLLRRVWPLSRVNPIRVGILPFDDGAITTKEGGALAALVRTRMEAFGGERTGLLIDSQAAIEETLWTKFGAINDQAKTVSAVIQLLGRIYPYRQFEATGILQAAAQDGSGISLSLRRRRDVVTATTLWVETFWPEPPANADPKAQLRRLAGPIAAWVTHVTATGAGEKPGGAKDPISWAMFKAGSEWDLEEETETAARLYKAAIALDDSNWGAHTQLGVLENDAADYRSAVDHLRSACAVLEGKDLRTPGHRRNPDWYRVKFRLASTLANEAYVHETSFDPAAKEIDELLDACWWAREPWPWERLSKSNRALREFVSPIAEPAALDLKALICLGQNGFDQGKPRHQDLGAIRSQLQRGEPVAPRAIIDALIADRKHPRATFFFDIACFFQLAGKTDLARDYARKAWRGVPPSEVKRYERRVADDPMLREIPDVRAEVLVEAQA